MRDGSEANTASNIRIRQLSVQVHSVPWEYRRALTRANPDNTNTRRTKVNLTLRRGLMPHVTFLYLTQKKHGLIAYLSGNRCGCSLFVRFPARSRFILVLCSVPSLSPVLFRCHRLSWGLGLLYCQAPNMLRQLQWFEDNRKRSSAIVIRHLVGAHCRHCLLLVYGKEVAESAGTQNMGPASWLRARAVS